jgi:hypothetical protein
LDDKPIKSLDITAAQSADGASPTSPIPRKKKSAVESNGQGVAGIEEARLISNGIVGTKRSAEEALGHQPAEAKRSKTTSNGANGASANGEHGSALIIDDSTDGAIVIDDD